MINERGGHSQSYSMIGTNSIRGCMSRIPGNEAGESPDCREGPGGATLFHLDIDRCIG